MAGSIRQLAELPGRLVSADPFGRFALLDAGAGELLLVDTQDPNVAKSRIKASGEPSAVGPSGQVAYLDSGALVLWSTAGERWGDAIEAEWLSFISDEHLIVGGAPPQLSLVETTSLAELDRVPALMGTFHRLPIQDWGEALMLSSAGTGTLAFASNVGDDVHLAAVARVEPRAAGSHRLVLAGAGSLGPTLTEELPGERILDLALSDAGLFFLDSDDVVSRVDGWGTVATSIVISGSEYLADEGERDLSFSAVGVHADRTLLVVEEELEDRYEAVAVVVLGPDDSPMGWIDAPIRGSGASVELFGGGLLATTDGDKTLLWRYLPE